jgi:hypothetical protein
MPAAYEKMRDSFLSKGLSSGAAKGKAARIFNANRKPGVRPVTRNYEKQKALSKALRK